MTFAFGQGLAAGTNSRLAEQEQKNKQMEVELKGQELQLKAGALEQQKTAAQQKMKEEGFKSSLEVMKQLQETAANMPAIKPGSAFDQIIDTQKGIVAKFAEMTGQDPQMAEVIAQSIRASAGQALKPMIVGRQVVKQGEQGMDVLHQAPEDSKVVGNQLVQPGAGGSGAKVLHTTPREAPQPTDLQRDAAFAFPGDPAAQRKLVGDARSPKGADSETPLMKEAQAMFPDDPAKQAEFVQKARFRPDNVVSIDQRGELEAEKTEGRKLGEMGAEVLEERQRSMRTVENIGVVKQLAEQWKAQGGQLGSMAGTKIEASKFMQSVGMKPETFGLPANTDMGEALLAMSNEMAMGRIGGQGGMPANNFSEADRKFLVETVPNIENTERGFQTKLAIGARVAQRKIEAADIYEEARANKKSVSEAHAEVRKRLKDKDLFSEEEKKALLGIAKPPEKKVDFSKMSDREFLSADVRKMSPEQLDAYEAEFKRRRP